MTKRPVVLKRLELFGFKSFADKTMFHFEPGLTAVVGPNGCGKSNISDGIRWVLGEQKPKTLRGTRMEDVIFNGTDLKSPLNMAEVSLTFSNENSLFPMEFDEITVTRRLYRSGDSEYFINRSPVRLKDISELFMGTGIGTEAYSLVEQGKIDLMLSSRPEERRFLFEEAAGITRYKAKKKEALRKLEHTENNLLRINDIITEVKRQMDSIQRQVRRARSYQELFERLKKLELIKAAADYRQLAEEKKRLLSEQEQNRAEEKKLDAEVSRQQEIFRALQNELAENEENLNRANIAVINLERESDRARDRVSFNRERTEELERLRKRLEAESEKTSSRCEGLGAELGKSIKELEILEGEKRSLEKSLEEKDVELSGYSERIREAERYIEANKARVVELAAESSRLRSELARGEARAQNLAFRARRVTREKEDKSGALAQAKERLESAARSIDDKKRRVDSIAGEKGAFARELERLQEGLAALNAESATKNKELAASQSRLEILLEMKRNYEGFSPAVKALLVEKERNNPALEGIRGTVADFIEVTGGREIPVGAVLGTEAESIIADSPETARSAAAFLKESDSGRAKFIYSGDAGEPGETETDREIRASAGVEGALIGSVRTDEKYRGILEGLLRGAYLVKDADAAAALLRRFAGAGGGRIKFVTPDGTVTEDGALTAGTDTGQKSTGIINREVRIRQFDENLAALKESILKLQEEYARREKEAAEIRNKMDSLGEEFRAGENELNKAIAVKAAAEEEARRLEEEISLTELEAGEIEGETGELEREKKRLAEELEKYVAEETGIQSALLEARETIREGSAKREEIILDTSRVKTELASLTERRAGMIGNLDFLKNSLEEEKSKRESVSGEIEESLLRAKTLEEETAGLLSRIGELGSDREKKSLEAGGYAGRREELKAETASQEEKIRSLNDSLAALREELHCCVLEDKDVGHKIDALSGRMREAYRVEIGDFREEPEEAVADESEVERLRARLRMLGQVNLGAIEEDAELQERYTFLTRQRQDLEEARDSLNRAITKINRTTRALFTETFESIRSAFKDFYRRLFGGGSADLFLLDDTDVLEAGIEIVARPPGKKLQSIGLLSGGEKALTAIALLFAILKVRPTPFCVLDEIDAPLDEANIDRFTRLLQDFLVSSQFVVITHSKRTMEMADALYGVTMEDTGVSRIVSVRFTEEQRKTEEVFA